MERAERGRALVPPVRRRALVDHEVVGARRQLLDCLPLWLDHTAFARALGARLGRVIGLDAAAVELFCRHDWTGNVRELENAAEHLCVMTEGASIEPELVRRHVLRGADTAGAVPTLNLDEFERRAAVEALARRLRRARGRAQDALQQARALRSAHLIARRPFSWAGSGGSASCCRLAGSRCRPPARATRRRARARRAPCRRRAESGTPRRSWRNSDRRSA